MIFVRRDPNLIPDRLFRVAERAQAELERLPGALERKAFIERKSHIWRAFGRYLAKMSFGKCWYSESPDPHSFFDVDHFRPKKSARRLDGSVDDGYPWLAFSWDNFRYAAQCANRLNKDEVADQTLGKGDWFPLLPDSPCASWEQRCEPQERPALLDPVDPDDVDLIDIEPAAGRVVPSRLCRGDANRLRVEKSIEHYALNHPRLTDARAAMLRQLKLDIEVLQELLEEDKDRAAIMKLRSKLKTATLPSAPYSRAARALLYAEDVADLCARPEDLRLAA